MTKRLLVTIVTLFFCTYIYTQDDLQEKKVIQTFKDTRIINSHSVENIPAGKLDFRISHRFGDLAGSAGGWPTFYGLENASDVLMGFEYGISDNLMMGISRAKGAGPLKQNVHGLLKIKLITQEINGNLPFSFTVVGVSTASTMQKSPTEGVLHFFEKSSHRWSYHVGLHFARKFSERLALQFQTSWTYRNLVPSDDLNDLISVGGGARIQLTRAMGLILDLTVPLSKLRTSENSYYPALGVGFEFDTSGGHVFQVNFTNSTGIVETDFIPHTRSNWGDGEFRMGFTISRLFTL